MDHLTTEKRWISARMGNSTPSTQSEKRAWKIYCSLDGSVGNVWRCLSTEPKLSRIVSMSIFQGIYNSMAFIFGGQVEISAVHVQMDALKVSATSPLTQVLIPCICRAWRGEHPRKTVFARLVSEIHSNKVEQMRWSENLNDDKSMF